MHPSVEVIQSALAYARFPNTGFRKILSEHLKSLGNDLESLDYTSPATVDSSCKELNTAMSDIDSENERLEVALEDLVVDVTESET